MPTRKAIWKSMNTYPICDTPLYNLAQQSASLRYRNRAEITVLMREQNTIHIFIVSAQKVSSVNIALALGV